MHKNSYGFLWIPLVTLFLMVSGCKDSRKEPGGSDSPKALTVAGVVIVPKALENRIMATGNLTANEEVELRSEVPGRIVAINFEEGTFVEKGSLLLKIDDRELQSQLKKLQVEEKQAKDDLYRKEKLLELKAVSQEEYDQAFNAHSIVQAGIELVLTQISKTEINAPFGGHIGFRYVSPGGYVSSATLVARLQQTNPVKLEFAIPEKYRGKVHEGTLVKFRVEGSDSVFTGRVYAIEPRIDPATRNIPLRATCSNPRGMLIPGSFSRVEIMLDQIPDAIVIPSEAIIPILNGEKVFICRNGKARSQIIRTGIRTEREVQVTEGLQSGDTLITTGLLQLREEAAVKIRTAK